MAVNQTRDLNGDLAEGMSDGSYKKLIMDRGGVVETTFWEGRRDLNPWFDIREAEPKTLPDASIHVTPNDRGGSTHAPVVTVAR